MADSWVVSGMGVSTQITANPPITATAAAPKPMRAMRRNLRRGHNPANFLPIPTRTPGRR